jgi:hypothetical protein
MQDMKAIGTTLNMDDIFDVGEPANDVPYREAIGSLMYLSTCTRPDIATAVGVLSRFNNEPRKNHWKAVVKLFRYLCGTRKMGLVFDKNNSSGIIGFSDADWAADKEDRKSISGYVILLNGTAISWYSKKQSCAALSSTEAEFVAACEAAKEILWIKNLLNEMDLEVGKTMKLMVDNEACKAIAQDERGMKRLKHIDLKYMFLKELVAKGKIKLDHCRTEEQLADFLTKGLCKEKHIKCVNGIGLYSTSGSVGIIGNSITVLSKSMKSQGQGDKE